MTHSAEPMKWKYLTNGEKKLLASHVQAMMRGEYTKDVPYQENDLVPILNMLSSENQYNYVLSRFPGIIEQLKDSHAYEEGDLLNRTPQDVVQHVYREGPAVPLPSHNQQKRG